MDGSPTRQGQVIACTPLEQVDFRSSPPINDPPGVEDFGVLVQGFDVSRADARLEALGVPGDWLRGLTPRYGLTRMTAEGDRWFPDPEGAWACVLPEPAPSTWPSPWEPRPIEDFIAFSTTSPAIWWTWAGSPVLGKVAIERAEAEGTPLLLHATPLDWMRSRGRGCVILDWMANLRLLLGGVRRIRCADPALAKAIANSFPNTTVERRVAA